MANFLDQAGGLWARGALHGKVGGAFTSTATQHGGQEMTLFSIITNLDPSSGYRGRDEIDRVAGAIRPANRRARGAGQLAGGSNGYLAVLVRRQLMPGLISSLPGTAVLPALYLFFDKLP
jgi:hypothetical protein